MTTNFLVDLLTLFSDQSPEQIRDALDEEKVERFSNDENEHLLKISFDDGGGALLFIKANSVKLNEKNLKQVRRLFENDDETFSFGGIAHSLAGLS